MWNRQRGVEISAEGAPATRRRAHRVLFVFLVGSAVAHTAALVVLPQFSLHKDVPRVTVLEVVLIQAEPPRTPLVEPALAPPPERSPAPARQVAKARLPDPPRKMDAPASLLTLPEPLAAAEPAVIVPQPAETRAAPAAAKTEVATAALTPPTFSAGYLRNPPPRYPLAARRAGEQGTVTLKVLVTREGLPARVDVENTSGSVHLDSAALETVKTWRFAPARQGTEPVESWVLVPVVFRLEGPS